MIEQGEGEVMTPADQNDRRLSHVAEIVQALIETMRLNGLSKLDVSVGDIEISLKASEARDVIVAKAPSVTTDVPATESAVSAANGHLVRAPMIGTFYSSPKPGEPGFVKVGDRVNQGQPIGIIEAMKIMNEIVADRGGVVTELIAGNAQPVEYGSPLLRLAVDEPGG